MIGLVVIYKSDSTLPWWGFVIAVLVAIICIIFLVALFAITGLGISIRESPVPINVPQVVKAVNRNLRANDCRLYASWKANGQHVFRLV